MHLETILLNKINYTLKLKYHMVALIGETQIINKEQNKTIQCKEIDLGVSGTET